MDTGHVRIPGAEALRVEFDRSCSTERRHDPLTIMDGSGRIISIRSGRERSDWSGELRVNGDELKWKFNSDGSVNGWGWRFTVYPIMPSLTSTGSTKANGLVQHHSDRSVLSKPSMDLVVWLLDACGLVSLADRQIGSRLAAALAACAQLSALPASQRMWSLQSLRKLLTSKCGFGLDVSQIIMSESSTSSCCGGVVGRASEDLEAAILQASSSLLMVSSSSSSLITAGSTSLLPSRQCINMALSVLVKGLPEMLLRQFEYEDPVVRGGKHLLHSAFFKELAALACDLNLDSLPCCSETYKWAWFRRRVLTPLLSYNFTFNFIINLS